MNTKSYARLSNLLALVSSTLMVLGFFVLFVALHPPPLMKVKELVIKQDGTVKFDRLVIDDHFSVWTAELRYPPDETICSGSGVAHYGVEEPKRKIFTVQEFVSENCPEGHLPPGTTLHVEWVPTVSSASASRAVAIVGETK